MTDRLSRLESRVEALTRSISDIERRLSEVERKKVAPPRAATAAAPPATSLESDLAVTLSLVGRTLLALGGAYLLRAFTEAGALPLSLGVFLGLVYAALWIYLAYRAGATGKSTSASFHAAAAALVGYPLLWETTVRLHLLGPPSTAAVVLGFTLASLGVAWRWHLRSAAWVTVVAAFATAFALMGGTREVLPFAGVLVLLGFVGLWLGYLRNWLPLQWASAAMADLAVVLLTMGILIQRGATPVAWAMAVQLSLFLTYVGSFFRRNVVVGRKATTFEMGQAAAATLAGYGGAVSIAGSPLEMVAASAVGVAGALFCYASALRRVPELDRRNELLFSSLALLLLLLATSRMPGTALFWAGLAILGFFLGRRLERIALSLHGGVLLVAAAAASGLISCVAYAFGAPAEVGWPAISIAGYAAFVAALVSCTIPVPEDVSLRSGSGWAKGLALLIAVSGGSLVGMVFLAPLLAGEPGGAVDPGTLASLRSAVLAAAAIALGSFAGSTHLCGARFLLYPLLVVAGIKLVLEDFPRGRAPTIFVSLAFYGIALVLAPRIARRRLGRGGARGA